MEYVEFSTATGTKEDESTNMEHVFYENLPSNYNITSCIEDTKIKRDLVLHLMNCIREEIHEANNTSDDDKLKNEKDFELFMKSIESKMMRLYNELHYLDRRKYCGLSTIQFCNIVLDILSFICAVVNNGKGSSQQQRQQQRWILPIVGKVITSPTQNNFDDTTTSTSIEKYMSTNIDTTYTFAFNIKIRTSLFSIAMHILLKLSSLFSPTNKSLKPPSNAHPRLIIDWKILYKLLLLSFPFMDNYDNDSLCNSVTAPPTSAYSRSYSMSHYTVNVIIQCSKFYIQEDDKTGNEIWNLVKEDIWMSHSALSSHAAIILYLFLPSKCSSSFYTHLLPIWFDIWKNTDRCMSWDGIWLNLFCRARKYLPYDSFHWNMLQKHLLTYCLTWLNIPVGGKSTTDFPSPASIRSRSFPRLLLSVLDFDYSGHSSGGIKESEFMNFIRKLCKIVFYVISSNNDKEKENEKHSNTSLKEVIQFLSYLGPYFNASNHGYWTYPLGIFLQQFCYEFVRSIGMEYALEHLKLLPDNSTKDEDGDDVYNMLCDSEPYLQKQKWMKKDVVTLIDALLPLCQNAICSKNGNVAIGSVLSLLSLIEIDPEHVSITFLEFSRLALESVTLSHQVPSVLTLLTFLIQPLLRKCPMLWLRNGRLNEVMNLALAGLDCNDKDKTNKTLKFYKTVLSWIPIGDIRDLGGCLSSSSSNNENAVVGSFRRMDGVFQLGKNIVETTENMYNNQEYQNAIEALSDNTLLSRTNTEESTNTEEIYTNLEETCMTLSDWALAVLDRIFLLFHSTGTREKTLKHSVRANIMTNRDTKKGRNESILFYEFCEQFMSSLVRKEDRDMVGKTILRFLLQETCIHAVKNVALLCRALCYIRSADCKTAILDDILSTLCKDLPSKSKTTLQYYIRCVSGCVKNAGVAVLPHKVLILKSLDFTLSLEDKKCYKAGCKLLRKLLLNLCQCYPYLQEFCPTTKPILGKSAQFCGRKKVQWHVPTGEEIDFAVLLLCRYVVNPMREFMEQSEWLRDYSGDGGKTNQKFIRLRKLLKVIRYALRGCSSILLDDDANLPPDEKKELMNNTPKDEDGEIDNISDDDDDTEYDYPNTNKLHPHEEAMLTIIQNASTKSQKVLHTLRPTLCDFMIKIISFITSTYYEWEQKQSIIGNDFKISRELIQISSLLLKSRYHSSNNGTQAKQVSQQQFNKLLSREVQFLETAYAKYGLLNPPNGDAPLFKLHKDGEDGGKIISQRKHVLICYKFYENIPSQASSAIPKRLWMQYKQFPGRNVTDLFGDEVQKILKCNSDEPKIQNTLFMDRLNTYHHHPISYYEALIDGLFALSCHPKSDVRSEAVRAIGHTIDRYEFIVIKRLLRLVKIFSVNDQYVKNNIQYGIPCVYELIQKIITATSDESKDSKHVTTLKMRLSEICISLCPLLAFPRFIKVLNSSQQLQFQFLQIFHKSEYLLKFLPYDATHKMIMCYQRIFLVYRSQWYQHNGSNSIEKDTTYHKKVIDFLMDLLCDGWDSSNSMKANELLTTESKATNSTPHEESSLSLNLDMNSNTMIHWRNRLIMGFFLTIFVQKDDVIDLVSMPSPTLNIWTFCCQLIVNESGQPIQRVALGLLGRIITFMDTSYNLNLSPTAMHYHKSEHELYFSNLLHEKLTTKKFSHAFVLALVYDHREDRQVTGNSPAQWSAGVQDILHDATRNLAPSILFPYVNMARSNASFKVEHAQMIQSMFTCIGFEKVFVTDENRSMLHMFLEDLALNKLACAAPSEDQRNQRCTSAEIFAGIGRALLLTSPNNAVRQDVWNLELLPFLEKVISVLPMDSVTAFCDSIRFVIRRFPPNYFYSLTNWLVERVEKTLWQYNSRQESDESEFTIDGSIESFTAQSKWLSLLNYVLIEILWDYPDCVFDIDEFQLTWTDCICGRLLPRLLNAIGHPYEQCRNSIASTFFQICQCQRRLEALKHLSNEVTSKKPNWSSKTQNPGKILVKFMLSKPFHKDHIRVHYQFMLTIRTFIFHCIQYGDCKYECLNYVYPLMPLAFEFSVFNDSDSNSSDEYSSSDKDTVTTSALGAKETVNTTSNRILEAEISKAFRFTLATIASRCLMTHWKHEDDIDQVLDIVNGVILKENQKWQVRQVALNFLRSFQGSHRIIMSTSQTEKVMNIVINLLADDRREVSSAAQTAVTGVIAGAPADVVSELVQKFIVMAKHSLPVKSRKKRQQTKLALTTIPSTGSNSSREEKERTRRMQQQTSVLFLCACVLSRPYDTPSHVPPALAALSKHSFDTTSSYIVREAVKHCCSEYKKTHMSENWEMHRQKFTQEELESLADVVSTPHYYA